MAKPLRDTWPDRRAVLAALLSGALVGTARRATAMPARSSVPALALSDGPVIGALAIHRVAGGDTLPEIARRYGYGFTELVAVNPGVDVWLPPAGEEILLPGRHIVPPGLRHGVLINLAQQRLFRFVGGGAPESYAIGIGRVGRETRLGLTRVRGKRRNPVWVPPASIRRERPELPAVVAPGADNPLGGFAVYLAWPGYVIHGTNRPYGIGRRVSHGCIRLYAPDIAALFAAVPVGAPVQIVDYPFLLCRSNGRLYLECHAAGDEADRLERGETVTGLAPEPFAAVLRAVAGPAADELDWPRAYDAVRARSGVPVEILTEPGPRP